MKKLLFTLAMVTACGGGATTTTEVTETTAAPTTAAPATTAAPSTTAAASLTPDEVEALYQVCAGEFDPMLSYLQLRSGETKAPQEMMEVISGEPDPTSAQEAQALIAMACDQTELPPRPPTTTITEATSGGLFVMEFGDQRLEYEFEDCSAADLEAGALFFLGNGRQLATAGDGSEWQISSFIQKSGDQYEFTLEAIGPDGSPYFSASHQSGATLEGSVEGDAFVYQTTFKDNVYQGEPDTPVTVTITCDT